VAQGRGVIQYSVGTTALLAHWHIRFIPPLSIEDVPPLKSCRLYTNLFYINKHIVFLTVKSELCQSGVVIRKTGTNQTIENDTNSAYAFVGRNI
jgi:hypothetical protein